MRFRLFILLFLILLLRISIIGQNEIIHSDAYQYLEFLREEQAELDFQLQHKEITLSFYKVASTRLSILKELIINYGRNSQINHMPEYHVVITQDLETLIPDGRNKLKKAKPNQIIDTRWRFIKTITKGETFYLLERLNDSP
jgi:hypothetical protein